MRVSATARSKRIGSSARPGASNANHLRREQERECEQPEIEHNQSGGDLVGEQFGGGKPSLLESARVSRNEGGGEGALGEDGAEMIGQPESDEEGVGDRPGAEDRGHHHVADEAARGARRASARQPWRCV